MVRIKQRYLLLDILYPQQGHVLTRTTAPSYLKFHGPSQVSSQSFLNILKHEITLLFGDHGLGLSLSSLKVVYYSQATSTAILRVPRTYFQLTWAALTLLRELPAKTQSQPAAKCVVRVVRVSGTIKKAEQELLRRSRREIVRAKLADGDTNSNILGKLLTDHNVDQSPQSLPDGDDLENEEMAISDASDTDND